MLLRILVQDKETLNKKYKWLEHIQKILNDTGYAYLWTDIPSPTHINSIKRIIKDQEHQILDSLTRVSTKGKIYAYINESKCMQFYISHLKHHQIKQLMRFRTANNKLPVETGRHNNIPYEERKCPFCQNEIGDEFHFLLQCHHFTQDRRKYINKYYFKNPNMYKYKELMTSENIKILVNLSIFVKIIMKVFE